ncbi:MAG: UDP-3-O-acyl-N-acetylglucosamine deacetylase [Alphaproteobacteria bacterium]
MQALNNNTPDCQKTVAGPVEFLGVGLHSGVDITMTLTPAKAGTGIVFVRTDITDKNNEVACRWDNVTDTMLSTKITNDADVSVSTVEHVMAALFACEIDNVRIDINGPEVPILDGSSDQFISAIEKVGVQEQALPRTSIQILKEITVKLDEDCWITLSPSTSFRVDCDFHFRKFATLDSQHYSYDGSTESFRQHIARARTFGYLSEVEKLRSMGLAKGGSLENAVVIDGDKVLNEDGLRFDDECVRHKILDTVGDLYMAGAPIQGYVRGSQTGHGIHNKLLRALFADKSAWRYTTHEYQCLAQHPYLMVNPMKRESIAFG